MGNKGFWSRVFGSVMEKIVVFFFVMLIVLSVLCGLGMLLWWWVNKYIMGF